MKRKEIEEKKQVESKRKETKKTEVETKTKGAKKELIEEKQGVREETGSGIILFIGVLLVLIVVLILPNMNHILWKVKDVEVLEQKKEEKVPTTYSCSFGPRYDEFYKYTLDADIIFTFNKEGKLEHIVSRESYQTMTQSDYELVKDTISVNSEFQTVVYDEENNIIVVKTDTDDVARLPYPSVFDELKKYLSQSGYICSME